MCTVLSDWTPLCRVLVVLTSVILNGCLAAKYRPAPKATPPAVAIGITGAEAGVVVTIDAVIVFQGPGSWKRNAYWDEYVVAVANRTAAMVTMEDATLVGVAERPVGPRTEPWALERESRAAMKAGFWLPKGSGPEVGAGLTATGIGMAAGAAWGAASAGPFLSASAGSTFGAAFVGVAMAPVIGGATIYRNVSNRHDLEREFERRRIHLPLLVPAHATVSGSLFFPITPGPRTLAVRIVTDAGSRVVSLDLARIGQLHLKPPAANQVVPQAAAGK